MKNKNLLEIKDLHVNVEDKEILHGVELNVGHDEVHVLMGPNGTGKSNLRYAMTPATPLIPPPGDRSSLTARTLPGCL